ncbi:MAG TPA: DNA-3-methyladenine glycosylase I [Phycisphaerae bacterium]|nr:DNA-3-methyladenine glycosylase I [Phycisphaerae bacterium]
MSEGFIDIHDGRARCKWAATDPMLATYHDREWGEPINTDAGHLERMALEVFQCGLSWKIVLVKRAAFQSAFEGFEPQRVARFHSRQIDRLCKNAAIIRNRMKLKAIVENAKVFLRLAEEHGSYLKWFRKLAAQSPKEQKALYPLFKETFKFMGPETTKCYLMGVGKIPTAHDRHCWRA